MSNYHVSKYTFQTDDEKHHLIVNYLTGAIDLLQAEEAAEIRERIGAGNWEGYKQLDYLLDQGYLFPDEASEQEFIQEKYLEFMEEYENTPVQIIFSTTYVCNFGCFYCFQEEYAQNKNTVTNPVTDKFFSFINKKFATEKVKPYITMFGGESLLGGEKHRANIRYFLERAREYGYEVAIVTNGYELINYVPIFQETGVALKEIQVSLDGDPDTHDVRRITKSGKKTFMQIADGIDMALKAGFRVNMRPIVDKENMGSLPKLAEFCDSRGWLDYPSALFETTLGRNYELHTCQPRSQLYNRTNMWQEFVKLAKEHPILKKFHKPQFHGIRYLKENGQLPFPIFDACPAGKKEWAFDINGGIYGCTASVGVEKFKLGNYFNGEEITDPEQLYTWQRRNVLNMESCKNCAVSLSCGGGCGVLSANYNGDILATNCRPVKDLLPLGIEYYGLGEEGSEQETPNRPVEAENQAAACCSPVTSESFVSAAGYRQQWLAGKSE